jgi:cyanuric acid amidohydrolase
MPRLAIHRLSMSHPGDLSALAALIDTGTVRADEVCAVIGKTEGNGGLNDFTRGFFTQSLMLLLSRHGGGAPEALAARIPCVLSGGTEGALSPHYLVFAKQEGGAPEETGLAIGTAFSPPTPPHEVGRDAQIASVAQAVRQAMARAGIASPADVALVQVKAPCVMPEAANRPGAPAPPRSADPRVSMALSRAAAALGVALALEEVAPAQAREGALLSDFSLFSPRASISSGIEVTANEVVVLGRAPGWADGIAIGVRPLADLLDLPGMVAAFRDAGLAADPSVPEAERGRILGVLVKGEPDRSGAIRGQRHTMLGDTDLDPQRHLRGALGAIAASVAGDGRVFCSGGAEHQGPAGGGLVCVLARKG